jgi:hypothetical protein
VTAAAPLARAKDNGAATPPLTCWCPRRLPGRPSGLKGAAHRAARDGPAGRP